MSRAGALVLFIAASLVACRRDAAPELAAAAPVMAAPAAQATPVPVAEAPAPAAQLPSEWSCEAPGGRASIRQAPTSGGGCLLTGVVEGATRWTSDTCAGSREDLHFVSPDGERLLVLHPFPEHPAGNDWSEATVARIFVRGKEERRFAGAELVAAPVISDMSRVFSWVKGVGSGGGVPPRYAEGGGAVVLELADGATRTLGFDGSGAPGRRAPEPTSGAARPGQLAAAQAPPADPREADETTMWSWEDSDGAVHFTHFAAIPAAFRRRATPVTASVGKMGGGSLSGRGAWSAPSATYRSPATEPPSKHTGPRLNGLTDAERHEQEMARLAAEKAKNEADARGWEKQRELHRTLDRARAEGRR